MTALAIKNPNLSLCALVVWLQVTSLPRQENSERTMGDYGNNFADVLSLNNAFHNHKWNMNTDGKYSIYYYDWWNSPTAIPKFINYGACMNRMTWSVEEPPCFFSVHTWFMLFSVASLSNINVRCTGKVLFWLQKIWHISIHLQATEIMYSCLVFLFQSSFEPPQHIQYICSRTIKTDD